MAAFDTSRVIWRKSSRSSAANGGSDCVEVGALPNPALLNWRKSTRTGGGNGGGGNCVEVGSTPHLIGIRDSKLGDAGPQLWLSPSDFSSLLTQLSTDNPNTVRALEVL